ELVRECLELARLRHGLGAESLRYDESPAASGAAVNGDRDELRAAVSNLLDNAVKYSDKDVHVEVEVLPVDERTLAVRVRDSGIGIHHNQLKRIFKRFYRVPGHFMARFKGTGLGLFIVRSVVERHGGRVYAESEGLGRGSTFTIRLPRA
ncbi:MAG TPA: ATP-binding protein, partial [Pyrinomonadaceae bacterium]